MIKRTPIQKLEEDLKNAQCAARLAIQLIKKIKAELVQLKQK